MNEKSIEMKILDRLIWTFIFCIIMGMVGVVSGHVKVEYMEGLITGCLLTMITNLMKDLFFNDKKGDQYVKEDSAVLPETIQQSSSKSV